MNVLSKFFALLVIFVVIILVSCKNETTPPIIDENTIPSGICFDSDILPLVQSNCAKSGCHTGGDEDPDLSNYNNIMKLVKAGDPLNSKLYKYAIGSEMPPPPDQPLNLEQVTLIYGWIKQGALNNTCACDTNIYTFSEAVNPIIKRNCLGCHGANSNIPLNTFQQISDNADLILADITYQNNPMPKPPAAKLSDCKIRQIEKWIQSGKLNN